MRVEEFDRDYQITEYKMEPKGGEIRLSWGYKKATHFIVLVYDARRGADLEALARKMEEGEIDWSGPGLADGVSDEAVKVFLCTETMFRNKGQSYTIPAGAVKGKVPYGISVFPGMYDKTEKCMHIYRPKDPEQNTRFWQAKLSCRIRYEKNFFLNFFSKEKLCVLWLEEVPDYDDGALMYHVEGVGILYPLPESCLGKELYISVPKGRSVEVRVAEDYKKYYKVITEGEE